MKTNPRIKLQRINILRLCEVMDKQQDNYPQDSSTMEHNYVNLFAYAFKTPSGQSMDVK